MTISRASWLDLSIEFAPDYFKMTLQAMGDHWRRFEFPTCGMPFLLFALVDLEPGDFLARYSQLQCQAEECPCCADIEFSTVLLRYIPRGSQLHEAGVEARVNKLKQFLADLCVFAPLSTDIVECYHGYTQCQLHRWRGQKVTDPVAQERVFWASVTKTFGAFKHWMRQRYLDTHFFRRLGRFGCPGANAYTVRSEEKAPKQRGMKPRLTVGMLDHMVSFEKDLPHQRKLCGTLALVTICWKPRVRSLFGVALKV